MGQKQKTEKKEERLNDANNNGQATQAAWANKGSMTYFRGGTPISNSLEWDRLVLAWNTSATRHTEEKLLDRIDDSLLTGLEGLYTLTIFL